MSMISTLQKYVRGVVSWAFGGYNPYRIDPRIARIERVNAYRAGAQKKHLVVADGKPDDNVTVNFIRLLARRSVSYLFGEGVTIEHATEGAKDYLDSIYERNKGVTFLRKLGTNGALTGTCYVKIIEAAEDDDNKLPRLVNIDPAIVEIITDPEDVEDVVEYRLVFKVFMDGEEFERKQTIKKQDDGTWLITDWIKKYNDWAVMVFEDGRDNPQTYEHDFAPIVHWQNLMVSNSPYGEPDITDDVLTLQDKINFNASNINKLIRLYLDPKIWGKNLGESVNTAWGVGKILNTGENGEVNVIDTRPDLASAQAFIRFLRQALFDISQQVDLDSIQDKLGSLTNFGLKILFGDAMSLIDMKRDMYAEGLIELNRRLLILNGASEDIDGGTIKWPDVLPINEKEQAETLGIDLSNGLVSTESASKKRGYDWEIEEPLLDEQKQEIQQQKDNNFAEIMNRARNGNGFDMFSNPATSKQVPAKTGAEVPVK
jgi:hypothetical protein